MNDDMLSLIQWLKDGSKEFHLAGNDLEDVANEIEEMHYLARNLILSLTDMAERNMLRQVTIGFRDALDALSERVSR